MRPAGEVREVFRLAAQGLGQAAIAREVGVSRATVRDWLSHGERSVLERPMRLSRQRQDQHDAATCPRIEALDDRAYAYLLGQYLGDGCISPNGRSYKLRISTCHKSIDIQHLFLEACGQLGIVSRPNNRYSVSVARREAVERMDAIVGPRS
jgi:hypothetical protein